MLLLIRHNAHGPPANARVATQHRFAILGTVFLEFSRVHNARENFVHVVLLCGVAGENPVDFVGGIKWVARFHPAKGRRSGRPYFIYQRTDAFQTRFVIRFAKVHRPADLRVHLRTAQVLR